jgi:hypothetical protein
LQAEQLLIVAKLAASIDHGSDLTGRIVPGQRLCPGIRSPDNQADAQQTSPVAGGKSHRTFLLCHVACHGHEAICWRRARRVSREALLALLHKTACCTICLSAVQFTVDIIRWPAGGDKLQKIEVTVVGDPSVL